MVGKRFSVLVMQLFGCLHLQSCSVHSLSLCLDGSVLEVLDTRQENTFVCSGIPADYTVEWWISSIRYSLGMCAPRSTNVNCTGLSFSTVFIPTRPSDTFSQLTINPAPLITDTKILENVTLLCTTSYSGTPINGTKCPLTYMYGPRSVVVTSADGFPFDTNGTRAMTLRCNVSGSNPSPNISWIWLSNYTVIGNGQSLTFKPQPPIDDDAVVVCVGTNVVTNYSLSRNITLDLNYPPRSPPEIFTTPRQSRVYKRDNVTVCEVQVYKGDNVTVTCLVSGGKPVSETNITVTCASLQSNVTVQEGNNISTSVTFSPVTSADQVNCSCRTTWKNYTWYTHTVNLSVDVFYGPLSVKARIVDGTPFDSNGTQDMTLACTVNFSNPAPQIRWLWLRNNTILGYGPSLIIKPRPPSDDGAVVSCIATNVITNYSLSDNVTLDLNYAPLSSPKFSTIPREVQVYKGDNVSVECLVSGGKSVSETNITVTCPSMLSNVTVQNGDNITRTVTFGPVTNADQVNCSCRTSWKRYNWYTYHMTLSLVVFTPPSQPNISPWSVTNASNSSLYPYLALKSGTLGCQSLDPGHPSANYTFWENGVEVANGSKLSFDVLSRKDNGRTITCRATNAFTTNRQQVADAIFVLEVYYNPDISLIPVTSINSSQCLMISPDMRHCVVSEGQRVHFRCHATSNPFPERISWVPENETDSSDADILLIVSANRTRHNKIFTCNVVTAVKKNDTRLPFRASYNLSVTVKYPSRVLVFTVNEQENKSVVVRENGRVHFFCQAEGRPAPEMRIVKPDNSTLKGIPLGDIVVDDEKVELNVTLPDVSCDDAGDYICAINNGVGGEKADYITLIVLSTTVHNSETLTWMTFEFSILLGISAALAVVLLVVIALYLRKQRGNCVRCNKGNNLKALTTPSHIQQQQLANPTYSSSEDLVHSTDEPSPYANFDEEGVGCRLSYDEIGNICHKTVQVQDSQGPESSGTYEELRNHDMKQKATYAQFSLSDKTRAPNTDTYEELRKHDMKQKATYVQFSSSAKPSVPNTEIDRKDRRRQLPAGYENWTATSRRGK